MSNLTSSNTIWFYIYGWDHKNTWVLYGCNYPTAGINYGWKLDVLWSRQEIDAISDNSIHKKILQTHCLLGIVTFSSICTFIIQEKDMCYNCVNDMDIGISEAYFSSIIKQIKQNQSGFDNIW